jgi:hypothetical protein
MKRTRQRSLGLPSPPAPTPPAPAAEHPPPGMMDLEAARYWAGRGPRRRNRPPYSLKAMD